MLLHEGVLCILNWISTFVYANIMTIQIGKLIYKSPDFVLICIAHLF